MLLYINIKNILIQALIFNAIISAILVIISKNPVVSVIYLISLVLNAALFLVLKGMSFLGISYILIYLGAIVVLFLFVIMMINIKLTDILEVGSQYTKNIPLALTVSGVFLYVFFNILPSYLNNPTLPFDLANILNLLKESIIPLNNFYIPHVQMVENNSEGFNGNILNFYMLEPKTYLLDTYEVSQYYPASLEIGQNNWINQLFLNIIYVISDNWHETLILGYTHIISVAYSLYTYGAFWFLLCSLILLLAMIAPIYISKR